MTRDALVIGINQYPFLKASPGDKAQNLTTPASDAEAIACLLEKHGNFNVKRLPQANIDGKLQVNPEGTVKSEELEVAIANLFLPEGRNVPDTALLFFAGHGLRRKVGKRTKGFLATSDANPRKGDYGFSLQALREILEDSEIRQQVIWLDCCHAGELLNFDEANPGEKGKGRDRFFVAASREFEVAYKLLDKEHGALSNVLLRGLDPQQKNVGQWITSHSLAEFISEEFKTNPELENLPQKPILNTIGEIELIKGNKSESYASRFNRHAGLSNTETSSSQTNSSSPQIPPQLFEFLLQLDFKQHFKLVKTVLKRHQTVAFLVHGKSNCGQQLLVNRLRRVKPQWHKHSPISINVSSNGIGSDIEKIWEQVAKYLGKSRPTKPEQVFEAILDKLQTQDVIFIFSSIEYMLFTETLKPWLENFWLPLVKMVQENPSVEDTHLLMFLVDNCGKVCQSKTIFTEQFNSLEREFDENINVRSSNERIRLSANEEIGVSTPVELTSLEYHPHIPISLPPASPFSLDMIEDWLELTISFEKLSIPVDLTAQYLWENSKNGIPEYVFELICKHCGFRWEGGLARWLI